MGCNQTKMANIRPKWPELDQIICKKLKIKVKIDLIGQNNPFAVKIDFIGPFFLNNLSLRKFNDKVQLKF